MIFYLLNYGYHSQLCQYIDKIYKGQRIDKMSTPKPKSKSVTTYKIDESDFKKAHKFGIASQCLVAAAIHLKRTYNRIKQQQCLGLDTRPPNPDVDFSGSKQFKEYYVAKFAEAAVAFAWSKNSKISANILINSAVAYYTSQTTPDSTDLDINGKKIIEIAFTKDKAEENLFRAANYFAIANAAYANR